MIDPPAPRAVQSFAWVGGVAFVASLAYFVYFFTTDLETAVARDNTAVLWQSVVIDTALFTVFAVHHSVLARPAAKQWIGRVIPGAFVRPLYVWIASALFFLVCRLWEHVPSDLFIVFDAPLLWTTRAVQLAGLALIALAARSIDPLELAGIRQVLAPYRGASLPSHAEHAPRISRTFPYNVVRHPIYLGWILTTFGASPVTADRLLFAGLGAGYLVLAIPWEERSLVSTFGEEYRRYQTSVRWRLIPRIW